MTASVVKSENLTIIYIRQGSTLFTSFYELAPIVIEAMTNKWGGGGVNKKSSCSKSPKLMKNVHSMLFFKLL
jgi:hypothetical protein